MIRTNTVIDGGFSLVRTQPASIAIWALIHAVLAGVAMAIMIPQMAASGLFDPAELDPDKFQAAELFSKMGGFFGTSFVFSLVQSFVSAVLLCAAFRAALHPEQGGPGFLRVGMDEVRVFAMFWIVSIGLVFAAVVVVLMVVLAALVIGFVAKDAPVIAVLGGLALAVAVICGFVYAMVRLSLVYPLTFVRHALVVDEAWALTRGNFWSLFAAFLIIVLISFAMGMVASLPVTIHQMAEMMRAFGDPEKLESLNAEQLRYQLEMPLPMRIVTIALGSIANAVSLALMGGALAAATRALLAESGQSIDGESPAE